MIVVWYVDNWFVVIDASRNFRYKWAPTQLQQMNNTSRDKCSFSLFNLELACSGQKTLLDNWSTIYGSENFGVQHHLL